MRYLLAFLKKYSFFFLFILLEAAAFIWMMNGLAYQRSVMANLSGSLSGSVFRVVNNITNFANLGRENKKLLEENTRLKNKLAENRHYQLADSLVFDTLHYYTRDSLFYSKFVYEPVNFIHNTIHKPNNYLMTDKGRKSQIGQDMGIVNSEGVVGIVTDVSGRFSWGMSMLNTNIKLSAKLKKNNQLGTVEWDGKDFRYGRLTDVPAHIDVFPGDTIVTSGFSQVFPEDILIGFVEEASVNQGTNLYNIRFRYAADFNSLDYGYVIKNLMIKEIDSISNIRKPIR